MRPIKFRGMTTETKQWVYGYYCHEKLNDKHYIFDDAQPLADWRFCALVGYVEIDPATLGMFVGIKDKNGKEICGAIGEKGGDICLAALPEGRFPIEVVWLNDAAGFLFEWNDDTYEDGKDCMTVDCFTDIEVIGTVAENPELLEAK